MPVVAEPEIAEAATLAAPEETAEEQSTRLQAWAEKHRIQIPITDKSKLLTRFDRYKAKYRGQYLLDVASTDSDYEEFVAARESLMAAVESEDYSYDAGTNSS